MVDGKKFTFNPTACMLVGDKKLAEKAPPVPDSESEEESDEDLEEEGDMVPGRRIICSKDKKDGSKQNLKSNRILLVHNIGRHVVFTSIFLSFLFEY